MQLLFQCTVNLLFQCTINLILYEAFIIIAKMAVIYIQIPRRKKTKTC